MVPRHSRQNSSQEKEKIILTLPSTFYLHSDVVAIARSLLGKGLFTRINGLLTGGIITETEAYAGVGDRASHAYNQRRTPRTEVMYSQGGIAYVYLCYGIHSLLNVVTAEEGTPHAVLIRAIQPLVGIEIMLQRRKKTRVDKTLTQGPGTVTAALGIDLQCNGLSLQSDALWIAEMHLSLQASDILVSPRIGIAYAGPDAALPYRFQWQSPSA